jgi:hypothetical protein
MEIIWSRVAVMVIGFAVAIGLFILAEPLDAPLLVLLGLVVMFGLMAWANIVHAIDPPGLTRPRRSPKKGAGDG